MARRSLLRLRPPKRNVTYVTLKERCVLGLLETQIDPRLLRAGHDPTFLWDPAEHGQPRLDAAWEPSMI